MDLLFDFLSSSSYTVAWLTVVLNVFVKGTAVLMAAALLDFMLQKASASVRYLVWSLALGILIALPILPKLLPAWQINFGSGLFAAALQPPVSTDSAVNSSAITVNSAGAQYVDGSPDLQLAPTHNSIVAEENTLIQEGATLSDSASFSIRRAHWTTWTLMLWLAGVTAFFARLLAGFIGVWWLGRRSEPLVDDVWQTLLGELVDQMGLVARVKLLQSGQAKLPMTWGLFRPVIVLPANADRWSDERRRVVLIHELAHVKRRDWLVQVLAYVVSGLYWINPLVWIALRRLRIERERACDDHVLGMGVQPSDYADHLLQIARSLQSRAFSPLAVTMAQTSHLEDRLLAILNPRLHRGALTPKTMTLSVVLCICIAFPLAAMSPAAGDQSDGEVVATAEGQPVFESSLEDVADDDLFQPSASVPENAGQADQFPEERRQGLTQAESTEPIENDRLAESLVTALPKEKLEAPRATTLARLNSNLESYPEPRAQKQSRRSRNRRELRNVRDLEVLAEVLDDPDPKVREMAIRALDKIRDDSAVDLLIQALTDSNAEVRRRAARALGKIENPGTIQALGTALDDEDPQVRQMVIRALGDIEESSAVEWLIPLLRDPDVEIRREAARALGEIEDPGAVEALGAALNDQDLEVRQEVIQALGDIEESSAVEWLIPLLRDPDVEIRREAARALGEIGDPGAVEALGAALNDPDLEVLQRAIRALGRTYDQSAVEWLILFVTDANVEIRRRVAWALGQIGGGQAVEALNVASNDADFRVRRTALRALREIGRR